MAEKNETEKTKKRSPGRPKKNAGPIDIDAGTKNDISENLSVRPGDHVYLTVKASPDLTIGSVTLSNISHKTRCGRIPKQVGVTDLHKWDRAKKMQVISIGELSFDEDGNIKPQSVANKVRDERDADTLHTCVEYLDRGYESIRDMVVGLNRVGIHLGGWHPRDLLKSIREHESSHGNRRKVLDFIEYAIDSVGHVSFVNRVLDPDTHLVSGIHYDAKIKETQRG